MNPREGLEFCMFWGPVNHVVPALLGLIWPRLGHCLKSLFREGCNSIRTNRERVEFGIDVYCDTFSAGWPAGLMNAF